MSESIMSWGAIVIFLMFMGYMILGSLIERKKLLVGHETGIIVSIGVFISFLAWYVERKDFIHMMTFDEKFFFYFCLPPIIFSSGYNMKRKKFF